MNCEMKDTCMFGDKCIGPNIYTSDSGMGIPCDQYFWAMCLKKFQVESGIAKPEYSIDDYKKHDIAKLNAESIELLCKIQTDPIKFFQKYRILWLWGQHSNAGKTTLASDLLFFIFFALRKRVKYLEFYQLVDVLSNFKKKDDFLLKIKNYQVYLVDDFLSEGKAYVSEITKSAVFGFLSSIFRENKYVILTSDKSVNSISPEYSTLKSLILKSYFSIELKGSLREVVTQSMNDDDLAESIFNAF